MIRISVQLTLFNDLLLSVSKALFFFSSFIEPVYECDLYFFFLLPGDIIIIPVLLFFFFVSTTRLSFLNCDKDRGVVK